MLPNVNPFHPLLQRCQLVPYEDLRRLLHISKPSRIIRNDPYHLRRCALSRSSLLDFLILKKSYLVATSLSGRIWMPSFLTFGAYMNRLRKFPKPFVFLIALRIESISLLLCAASVIYKMYTYPHARRSSGTCGRITWLSYSVRPSLIRGDIQADRIITNLYPTR